MTATDPDGLTPDTIVAFLADLFARRGGQEHLGERVTMAEHMLQGAAMAERQGLERTVVVAALLHDVGHFVGRRGTFSMDDTHDCRHEQAGADFLAPFFPEAVTACVRHHVAAKRYLCTRRPDYVDRLTEASRHSLTLQGGPTTAAEAEAFERQPHLREILQVRELDDAGKVAGMATPPFGHFAGLVQEVVDAWRGAGAA